ncbi:MAG: bifunctional nuclease family protein [Chloroflexota bacterium]|nr:bifunctional nuclease family protein [Chloroflexota bacterium]
MLKETGGDRFLPIWVGAFEGDAAAILLVGAGTPRPLTFPFTARLVEAVGGAVQKIRIARLVDETFFAQVIVKGAHGTETVDARPSDAVALALVTHSAPSRPASGRTERPQQTSHVAHVTGRADASTAGVLCCDSAETPRPPVVRRGWRK